MSVTGSPRSAPKSIGLTATASAAMFVLIVQGAAGSPLFHLGEGGDPWFNSAAGTIEPVSASDAADALSDLFDLQTNQPDSVVGRQASLSDGLVVTDDAGAAHDALVMSWEPSDALGNDPDGMHLSVAGFRFTYAQDPDLTGLKIHFSILPPPGIWDFALILTDSSNRNRKWMDFGPPNVWGDRWIMADLPTPQTFDLFTQDPGFDITQVISISLYEAGTTVVATNPDGTVPPGFNWNAWNHLSVMPEPTSGVVALVGFAFAAALRRR